MRLLLDTHAFLWWSLEDRSLPQSAYAAIEDRASEIFVSAASAWEIATKHRIGKLPPAAAVIADDVAQAIRSQGFFELAITVTHGDRAGAIAGAPKDPFDRMLIAQALLEDMTLVSNETAFDAFGIRRLW